MPVVRRLFEVWQVEGVSRVFTVFAEIKGGFAFDRPFVLPLFGTAKGHL